MHRTRRSSLVLAGAAVALLAGCGGSGGPAKAAPSPSGPSAVQLVQASAVSTDKQRSSRYLLTTTTKVNGTEVVFSGEGILDWTTDTGETVYDVPGGQVNQRLLGEQLFLSLPQQPGVYFRLKSSDVAASPVGGTVDPTAQLHLMAAVSEAEEIGEEDVRGEPTTVYRGTYDVARALEAASDPVQQASLKSLLGLGATMTEAPYDVFLDEDGLLRRLEQTIEVPAGDATGGQTMTVTTTLELYDFGVEVVVKGPADPKSVKDGAPLLDALRKALPKPVPPKPDVPATPSAPAAPAPAAPAA